MEYQNNDEFDKEFYSSFLDDCNLRADCKKCFGFCCSALYFSASEGFPEDKVAGKPCVNLQPDFTCCIHHKLDEVGMKGCVSYECFGAGQRVAQITYGGNDWHKSSELVKEMYDVFLVMLKIHEILWYLQYALNISRSNNICEKIIKKICETRDIAESKPELLINLDLTSYGANVGQLIDEVISQELDDGKRTFSYLAGPNFEEMDMIGKDLRKKDLRYKNLKGAFHIASDLRKVDLCYTNLMWADLRDADIRGADISRSLFVTQMQINSAIGDSQTKLPKLILRPSNWQ